MPKSKSKATIMVADGVGGMVQAQDLRFEPNKGWPIQFELPSEQAETWLRCFYAECESRGWSSSSMGQIEARENSGSVSVNAGTAHKRQLSVVWERRRTGAMRVRAQSIGEPELPLVETQALFDKVNERCRSGLTESIYSRGMLAYDGLPWRGEYWLDDTLRLGPPSRQDETFLIGPRIILVDAMVNCIGRGDAPWVFEKELRELSIFLSVAMGKALQPPKQGRVWTTTDTDGSTNSVVRNLGYWEPESPQTLPSRGTCRDMPLRLVVRPDFSQRGVVIGLDTEQSLPSDVAELWSAYRGLTPDKRGQFLQAGAKWQESLMHWGGRSTLSFALMVVACEALKPSERKYRDHNVYHVVETLFGKTVAEQLRADWFRPQDVRNAHLHSGELRGSEFIRAAIMSSYQDPTFDQARRAFAPIAQESIIEWLRRRGELVMPPIEERKKSFRRWLRGEAPMRLLTVAAVGVALGWLMRMRSRK